MGTKREEVKKAHRIIAVRVRNGRIPKASTLACIDCGSPAACYDHYLGYADEHLLDIQAVCYSCHQKRTWERGEMQASSAWRKKIADRMRGNTWNHGRKFTEEHKKKISESNMGRSTWATGKKFTDAHRSKISKSRTGIKFTEIHKQRISEGKIGKKHSKETRIKIGLSRIGSKRSAETKEKMSKARRLWWKNKNKL